MPLKDKEKARAYMKEYRAANREKLRAANAAYLAANREKVRATKAAYYAANREKAREYHAAYYAANREKALEYHAAYRAANRELHMWNAAKKRAKTKNLPFTITPSDIVIPPTCPVLGIPLQHGCGNPGPNSPSLDRIVPDRGYVPENVIVVSYRANTIKQDATPDEIALVAAFYQQIWNKSMEPQP
jgi:hypothetical protein